MSGKHKEKKDSAASDQTHEVKDAREMAARRADELLKRAGLKEGAVSSAAGQATPLPHDQVAISRKEYEELKETIKAWTELKDRWLRQAADFENAKKRLQRERDELYKFAHQGLVSELLPIFQNLDRVILHAEKQNGKSDPFVEGIELIVKQIHQVLESSGVKRIDTVGKVFDPHFHEAVAHVVSDKGPEIILEETEPGYLLHDRLLKPAKVIISKGSADVETTGEISDDKSSTGESASGEDASLN